MPRHSIEIPPRAQTFSTWLDLPLGGACEILDNITPVTRRSFHRSGYTPYDSAGGPAAGPASPIILSPAPEAPRRPATNQEAVAGRSSPGGMSPRSEEHTSELQSLRHLVCRL